MAPKVHATELKLRAEYIHSILKRDFPDKTILIETKPKQVSYFDTKDANVKNKIEFMRVILVGNHAVYERGDLVKTIQPHASTEPSKDDVCMNLVREVPQDHDATFKFLFDDQCALVKKTDFQHGYYACSLNDVQAQPNDPQGPSSAAIIAGLREELDNISSELQIMTEYARKVYLNTHTNVPANVIV
jgi:hypothetical protein